MRFLGSSVALVTVSAAYYMRRRISKKWIDFRSSRHDLSDKTILITGGNVGLGYEAAKDFVRRNANVIIACRSLEKGNAAVASIEKSLRGTKTRGTVTCMDLDLASLDSLKEFVERVKSDPECEKIHALVCNAGVWVPPEVETTPPGATRARKKNGDPNKYKTKDGFEIHFGVNHLSHTILATNLKDQLHNSGDGRVVFVSSSLMTSGKTDFNKFDHIYEARKNPKVRNDETTTGKKPSFAPPGYCDSKLMNALTCRYLSTRNANVLPPTTSTYAVCPGFCRSSLGRNVSMKWYQKLLLAPVFLLIQRTAVQGAQNIIFATVEDKNKLKSGEFYRDGEIAVEQTDYVDSLGEDLPKTLWEVSERLVRDFESEKVIEN